jgi:hypothetical protein
MSNRAGITRSVMTTIDLFRQVAGSFDSVRHWRGERLKFRANTMAKYWLV